MPTDEPIEWGGYDYMVVNGVKPVSVADLVEQPYWPDGEPVAVAPAKPKPSASAS